MRCICYYLRCVGYLNCGIRDLRGDVEIVTDSLFSLVVYSVSWVLSFESWVLGCEE